METSFGNWNSFLSTWESWNCGEFVKYLKNVGNGEFFEIMSSEGNSSFLEEKFREMRRHGEYGENARASEILLKFSSFEVHFWLGNGNRFPVSVGLANRVRKRLQELKRGEQTIDLGM